MAEKNLTDEMWAGNRKVQQFTVTDQDAAGVPLDITSLTLKWALSQIDPDTQIFSTTAILEKVTGTGIIHTDATNGVAQVTLVEADTKNLTPADYHFELEVFDATPEGVVVAEGTLTINPNVVNTL